MVVTVYRVEHHKTRVGPFRTSKGYDVINRKADDVNRLPTMHSTGHGFDYDDPQRRFAKNGCRTSEQLRQWFGRIAEDLDSLGFVVRVYKVKEVIAEDDYQCLAWLKRKRARATYKLVEFFLFTGGPASGTLGEVQQFSGDPA